MPFFFFFFLLLSFFFSFYAYRFLARIDLLWNWREASLQLRFKYTVFLLKNSLEVRALAILLLGWDG